LRKKKSAILPKSPFFRVLLYLLVIISFISLLVLLVIYCKFLNFCIIYRVLYFKFNFNRSYYPLNLTQIPQKIIDNINKSQEISRYCTEIHQNSIPSWKYATGIWSAWRRNRKSLIIRWRDESFRNFYHERNFMNYNNHYNATCIRSDSLSWFRDMHYEIICGQVRPTTRKLSGKELFLSSFMRRKIRLLDNVGNYSKKLFI